MELDEEPFPMISKRVYKCICDLMEIIVSLDSEGAALNLKVYVSCLRVQI